MATETEIEAALDGFYMRQADSMHDRMAAAIAALDRARAIRGQSLVDNACSACGFTDCDGTCDTNPGGQ